MFGKVFGLRTTPKVWGFQSMRENDWSQGCGPGLVPECRWIYSSTENMVWEGTTAAYVVNLTAGVATITLTVVGADGSTAAADSAADLSGDRWGVESGSGELITERNVDAILLHPNQTDIDFRMNTTLFPNCNPPHSSGLFGSDDLSSEVFVRTGDANGLVFDSLVATQVVALPNA